MSILANDFFDDALLPGSVNGKEHPAPPKRIIALAEEEVDSSVQLPVPPSPHMQGLDALLASLKDLPPSVQASKSLKVLVQQIPRSSKELKEAAIAAYVRTTNQLPIKARLAEYKELAAQHNKAEPELHTACLMAMKRTAVTLPNANQRVEILTDVILLSDPGTRVHREAVECMTTEFKDSQKAKSAWRFFAILGMAGTFLLGALHLKDAAKSPSSSAPPPRPDSPAAEQVENTPDPGALALMPETIPTSSTVSHTGHAHGKGAGAGKGGNSHHKSVAQTVPRTGAHKKSVHRHHPGQ